MTVHPKLVRLPSLLQGINKFIKIKGTREGKAPMYLAVIGQYKNHFEPYFEKQSAVFLCSRVRCFFEGAIKP